MGICEQVRKKDQKYERLSNKKVEPEQNRFTWFTLSGVEGFNKKNERL